MKTWSEFLLHEQQQAYYLELQNFISTERAAGKTIYPKEADIFQAFSLTPLSDVKVVILGQDPYHGPEQAHGLCFSVLPGIKIPPSLRNMYKELTTDLDDFNTPDHGYLVEWAQQGILMLNTVLTVEQAKAHSHAKSGWETFTDHVVELLNQQDEEIIFVLWGNHAKKKGRHIDRSRHYVLEGVHPSPLSASRGFFGCQHFSSINARLLARHQQSINWQVSDIDSLV
ncbi:MULTISPECIES: uracil-DNA glycosylase [unclassified Moritella]|uniref:uracil-DNA glycosylase n=1 Tax=unclassified Moritella TaxID=2637987 RepID=UPI001BA8DB59|nr:MULTISPECIES: uracil-DNA glycosylase [unclassified Moritella]QUM86486.1 uracil-DNA glycosylase [Moritella sp. 28]QUM90711.1 uracil-DNA glycosylase [Moritella sp. 36]